MARGVFLPKSVYIDNLQLWFLYRVLLMCSLGVMLTKFFLQNMFTQTMVLSNIHGSVWMRPPSANAINSVYTQLSKSELCANPELYSFDVNGLGTTQPQGCNHSCLHGDAHCLHSSKLFFQESDSQVMLTTRIAQRTETTGTAGTAGNHRSSFDYFIPEVSGLSVALSYSFSGSSDQMGSSMTNTRTRLRDKNGRILSTYNPGPFIEFSVQDLLSLAGHSAALTQPNPWMQSNATGYATGLELRLQIACKSIKFDEPICDLEVERGAAPWVTSTETHIMPDGSATQSTFYGLRIVAVPQATIGKFSIEYFLDALIDCIVLFKVPSQIVYFFSVLCLGHLSKIYRSAACEHFVLAEHVAGLATRLIVNNVAWMELQDSEGCMSQGSMYRWLRSVFRGVNELDDEEIRDLTTFCFNAAVVDKGRDPLKQMISDVSITLFGGWDGDDETESPQQTRGRKMTATDFNEVCSSGEAMRFTDIVQLFDVARPRFFLERFFEPRALRKYIFEKKRWKKQHTPHQPHTPHRPGPSSSSLSLASLSDDPTLGAIASARRNDEILKDLALVNQHLEERVASLEEKVQYQCQEAISGQAGFLNMAKEQSAKYTEMQQKLASLETGHHGEMARDFAGRVESLESLSRNLRDSQELFLMGDAVLKAHSQIVSDLQTILQSKGTGSAHTSRGHDEQVVSSTERVEETPQEHDHDCPILPDADVKNKHTKQVAEAPKWITGGFTLMPECCARSRMVEQDQSAAK